MKYFFILFALWNGVTMFTYGVDKLKARNGTRRISENCLLTVAFLMGALGALFGMVVFNHKTSKMKFRILVPFFVVVNITILLIIFF